MHPLLFAIVSIFLSVAAQFFLKAGMSSSAVKTSVAGSPVISTFLAVITQPYVILGFFFYGLGAVIWLAVLSRWDVSKAYPLVGFGFALTVLIGWMVGEEVSLLRVCGVFLICSGVWLVAQS